MQTNEIIETLRQQEAELRSAGIVQLFLFGSVARGDNTANSDVDLMAAFDKSRRYTLLNLGSLQDRLSSLVGAKVDLSSPDWMKAVVRERAFREAIRAF